MSLSRFVIHVAEKGNLVKAGACAATIYFVTGYPSCAKYQSTTPRSFSTNTYRGSQGAEDVVCNPEPVSREVVAWKGQELRVWAADLGCGFGSS